MDRIPKELVERMDAITKAASDLLEQRKADEAKAPAELNEAQLDQVRQCVLDTIVAIHSKD